MDNSNSYNRRIAKVWWPRVGNSLAALALLNALLFNILPAQAAQSSAHITFNSVDVAGQALEHVVMSLHSDQHTANLPRADTDKIMDQKNMQFAPTVLAVQTGTRVNFPNQDDVRHHVYSFSHPNAFELKLYHAESDANQRFEHEGVVVLGCNIHDGMIGYLRVVNTPLFTTSDAKGVAQFDDIPPGDYELQVWHPDMGMKVARHPIRVTQGVNTKVVKVKTNAQAAPSLKAAHPLQSLFRY